jgi:hypothetical protein
MTDPRNIQHDKKVQHDKKHHGDAPVQNTEHVPQPGKKPHLSHEDGVNTGDSDSPPNK